MTKRTPDQPCPQWARAAAPGAGIPSRADMASTARADGQRSRAHQPIAGEPHAASGGSVRPRRHGRLRAALLTADAHAHDRSAPRPAAPCHVTVRTPSACDRTVWLMWWPHGGCWLRLSSGLPGLRVQPIHGEGPACREPGAHLHGSRPRSAVPTYPVRYADVARLVPGDHLPFLARAARCRLGRHLRADPTTPLAAPQVGPRERGTARGIMSVRGRDRGGRG